MASSSNAPQPPADTRELRILLVEDSAALRQRLARLLTTDGVMRVDATAETELEACSILSRSYFDVLVVDVQLKQGSGIGVVRAARARWAKPPLPLIVILTNYAIPAVKERCIAAGADHFLDKMLQFDELLPLITRQRFIW